jgi:sugar phosphate isomerase/epimerase
MQSTAPIVERLGLKLVTLHAGFIPDDPGDSAFAKGIERIDKIADVFARRGAAVALETGQESAQALLRFLTVLGRRDVGVNFDPGNMILYGSGDPIAALELLMPHVKQVHGKDATRSERPMVDWGKEMPIGGGQVDWSALLGILVQAHYTGDLVLEREAGAQRVPDIVAGVRFLRERIGKIQ